MPRLRRPRAIPSAVLAVVVFGACRGDGTAAPPPDQGLTGEGLTGEVAYVRRVLAPEAVDHLYVRSLPGGSDRLVFTTARLDMILRVLWAPDKSYLIADIVGPPQLEGLPRYLLRVRADGSGSSVAVPAPAWEAALGRDGRLAYKGFVPRPAEPGVYDPGIFVDGALLTLFREGESGLAWSTDGAYLLAPMYGTDDVEGLFRVRLADASTTLLLPAGADPASSGRVSEPTYSPDGSRIAFQWQFRPDGQSGIWTMNADGSDARFLHASGGARPVWSPDGSRLLVSDVSGVWAVKADGTDPRLVLSSAAAGSGFDWVP